MDPASSDATASAAASPVDGAPKPSTALLEARNLYRLHPGRDATPVLQDVSLAVPEGKFVVVMGPSGSGKSTLLHLLCGLDAPSAGQVFLAGQELGALDDEARTRLRREHVGFVFQFYNLVPNLTVGENIALPLLLQGITAPWQDARFGRVTRLYGLADKLSRRPHELSGGEMQRTSIARAVVHEPRVVLADEPTGNLATKAGLEVMQHLRTAVDALGRTIVLVTHNPRDARFADELHFLKDGRIDPAWSLRGDEIDEHRIHARLEQLGI
ncbi:MAG: ABC transporter ATP-binding protein [Planctomycetes bacterium]|nr:ABC transporter ATP-binding protein [Planctomycetota bacterium]